MLSLGVCLYASVITKPNQLKGFYASVDACDNKSLADYS